MNYQIYGLCDPDTGKMRYIGQSNNPERRLKQHMSAPSEALWPWLIRLKFSRQLPQLVILEDCSKETKDDLEQWWLHWGARKKQPLLNVYKRAGWYIEMQRRVEGCPYCGMYCGWTLRGGCSSKGPRPMKAYI